MLRLQYGFLIKEFLLGCPFVRYLVKGMCPEAMKPLGRRLCLILLLFVLYLSLCLLLRDEGPFVCV